MSWFRKKEKQKAPRRAASNLFSTDIQPPEGADFSALIAKSIKVKGVNPVTQAGTAMDSGSALKFPFGSDDQIIPDMMAYWYGNQTFIGYQLCAVLAQNWLIDKACSMPARDAIRTGYEISVPEGKEVSPEKIAALQEMDERFKIMDQMVEFVRFNRIFGIRHALFLVDTDNPDEYYLNPFNIDAVKPKAYKGIAQIDPYWITPELDQEAAANPGSKDFYEPTWWRVNGKRIHKSHFIIIRTGTVSDILKPTYFYGGVSIPQKIFERVYASERTANEAPLLALTKRTTSMKTDLSQAEANPDKFKASIGAFAYYRDNQGVRVMGLDDVMEQFDTSLADLDAVIMTQYQLVAAGADVPATKLLGTAPKGFNSTGEYEEASYHEMLESLQEHDLTPFLQRHHDLCIKSEISPDDPFQTQISWNSLDTYTAAERADINNKNAQTGQILTASGAIDGIDERQRITLDKDSGYANLPEIERDVDELISNEENDENEEPASDKKA
jgi:phage-related protein (TIGR01555 family)